MPAPGELSTASGRSRAIRALAALGALLAIAAAIVIAVQAGRPPVAALARSAPARTALMEARLREAAQAHRTFHIDQRWVPYARISPILRRAVLVAEDDAFFSHDGLDWDEIQASARANLKAGRVVRGGSTITQQLARNLYLGEQRSLTRKLEEVVLAFRLERVLDKRRIFELYLNEIEWGDGIFGIESAARHYFGVTAASLTPRQSAYLAAVIINPRRYSPVAPSRRIERRARTILSRLHRRSALTDAEYLEAIGAARPSASRDSTGAAAPPETTDASGDILPGGREP